MVDPFLNSTNASYEALSYMWGDQRENLHPIKINNCTIRVTYSLWWALPYLRHRSSPRILWIDAPCINQANDVERSQQVSLMREICGGASKIIGWLGMDEEGRVKDAFDFVKDLRVASLDSGARDIVKISCWPRGASLKRFKVTEWQLTK